MGWNAITFLAEPTFVIPWYVFGVIGGALVIADINVGAAAGSERQCDRHGSGVAPSLRPPAQLRQIVRHAAGE